MSAFAFCGTRSQPEVGAVASDGEAFAVEAEAFALREKRSQSMDTRPVLLC